MLSAVREREREKLTHNVDKGRWFVLLETEQHAFRGAGRPVGRVGPLPDLADGLDESAADAAGLPADDGHRHTGCAGSQVSSDLKMLLLSTLSLS